MVIEARKDTLEVNIYQKVMDIFLIQLPVHAQQKCKCTYTHTDRTWPSPRHFSKNVHGFLANVHP